MNFVELCIKNKPDFKSVLGQIDDYVKRWHESPDNGQSLAQFIGFTDSEYAIWSEEPDLLEQVVWSHIDGRILCTKHHPWNETMGKRVIHPRAKFIKDIEDFELNQTYSKYKCPYCNTEFEIEQPQ